MNILSTLIFSDPSLGYNKADFEFPIDINKKYPSNGSGLCNQEIFIGMENNIPLIDGTKHSSSFSIMLKYITDSKKIIMV